MATDLEKDAQALKDALQTDGDEVTVSLSRQTAELLAAFLDNRTASPDANTESKHAAVAELFAMQNGWD